MNAPTSARPDLEAAGRLTFADFALSTPLRRAVTEAGFTAPRPIQAGTIPAALEGRDILGLAPTGTGKTLAFALPILERILAKPGPGPRALIVAPTRELANQIETEFRTIARFTRIQSVTIFGGVSMHGQVQALRRRPEILIACPGRLLDLYEQRAVRFDAIETLVLDEADHMFDMGFLPDIRRILSALPPKRQNLLYSATMPGEIRGLADRILVRPHVVELGHSKPAATIEHALYPVVEQGKLDLLKRLLTREKGTSAIVFTRTKHRAKRLALQLEKFALRAIALQGNMSQSQRDRAMGGFREGRFDILVATDIASRGIDVAEIAYVINYDVPMTPDAYTHRIGRTGRAECKGKAITFVTSDDREAIRDIERRIGASIPRVASNGAAEDGPASSTPIPQGGLIPFAIPRGRPMASPPQEHREDGKPLGRGGNRFPGRRGRRNRYGSARSSHRM